MTDGRVEQTNTYSDLPNPAVNGSEITITTEQTFQSDRAKIAELEIKLVEMRDLWMRAEAETANVKLRAKKDVEQAKQYGQQFFATDVVGAAEDIRRGLDSLNAQPAGDNSAARLHDGFAEIERSFVAMLQRHGIKRHDPEGAAFDPNTQQAMGKQEGSAQPPGTVVRALTSTWTLNGRLLRPAMVIVAAAG